MKKSSWERWAPLTGVVGAALLLGGAAAAGTFSYLPPEAEAVDMFRTSAPMVTLGSYLGGLAAFFLAWFAGSLRSHLARHEGGDGRLAALGFAGGVGGALSVGLGFILLSIGAGRVATAGGLSPQAAVLLYDLSGTIQGGLFAVALGVQVLATSLASLRYGAFPGWFGLVSAALALLLLSPLGYLGLFLAPLWLVVLSLWIYRRQPEDEGRTP